METMEQTTRDSALLVMDMQVPVFRILQDPSALLQNTVTAIAHAREHKIPVIHVIITFRNGAPEISMNNKGFSPRKATWTPEASEVYMKIHPDLAPLVDEIIVTKRRVSAFTGSDLEVILRSLNIRHIVLTGIATSGVVLSTLREAADKDYRITVLSDCCADADEEVHRMLTSKVFPRQAEVMSVEEWMANASTN